MPNWKHRRGHWNSKSRGRNNWQHRNGYYQSRSRSGHRNGYYHSRSRSGYRNYSRPRYGRRGPPPWARRNNHQGHYKQSQSRRRQSHSNYRKPRQTSHHRPNQKGNHNGTSASRRPASNNNHNQQNRSKQPRNDNPGFLGNLDPTTKQSVNNIYKVGQLIHNLDNWESLPDSVAALFRNVADNIHPAHDVDKAIASHIENIISECAEKVRTVVVQHYETQAMILASEIYNPDDNAFNIAATRLHKKYKKFKEDFDDRLYSTIYCNADYADNGMDNDTDGDLEVDDIPSTPKDLEAVVNLTTPPAEPRQGSITTLAPSAPTPIPDSRKRRKVNSPPLPVIGVNSTGAVSIKPKRITAKVHPPKSQGVSKCGWDIKINEGTSYLVIGDSNLKKLQLSSASQVQIESYPGATLENINNLLVNVGNTRRLKHVFTFVGINDRNNGFEGTTQKRMRNLSNALKHLGTQHSFIAVPHSEKLPRQHYNNVTLMNDFARRTFGNFIKLPADVTETDNVHLNDASMSALADVLNKFITDTEASNIQKYMVKNSSTKVTNNSSNSTSQ